MAFNTQMSAVVQGEMRGVQVGGREDIWGDTNTLGGTGTPWSCKTKACGREGERGEKGRGEPAELRVQSRGTVTGWLPLAS